ncbi:MAG: DUF1566 domain-containing protein [Paraprevotella sp.]|nr:DUF1566 domain-containing protein [Paraprevotella sp.]
MKKNYLCATLLLFFGVCGLSLTSCGGDDEETLSEVTVPGTGDDKGQGDENDGNDDGNGEGEGKEDEGNTGTTVVNGHKAVDLGLSVKWATCNVGASSPEEYGGYYAWGETEEKSNYDFSTYKYCKGSNDSMTKYCTESYSGTVDNKTVLEPGDDVAHVKWGGSWRMPTSKELNELINNCFWRWTTQNGVKGYVVTSESNGNSIFLPAAGSRWDEIVDSSGSVGLYWSASLNESYSSSAYYLGFDGGSRFLHNIVRYYGFSVRPVAE